MKRTLPKVYRILAVSVVIIILLPLIITFFYSIMDHKELGQYMTLKHYQRILLESEKFSISFWRSIGYSFTIVLGQLLIGTTMGFVFSKFYFKGRDVLFFIVITAMMMPFQVTMVPNFITLRLLNMINTGWAIILPGIFSAFGIFIMRQFMLHIPDSFIEAAQIEGASTYLLFLKIVLPLSKGGITALFILSFIENWNMIEQPLVFLNTMDKMPLAIIIREATEQAPETVFAPSILYMLPAVGIYFIFEDALIHGIEKSFMKG